MWTQVGGADPTVRVREVGGSNPLAPTRTDPKGLLRKSPLGLFLLVSLGRSSVTVQVPSQENPDKTDSSFQERYQREILRVVTALREHYAPGRIVLFGSGGRGDIGEDSDIDLLIVKETDRRPLDRMRDVYSVVYSPDHYLALDPLVYTPSELARRLESGDCFLQEIVRQGTVLYERE